MPLAESCLPKPEVLDLELHPGYSPIGELQFRLQTACLVPPEAMQRRFYKFALVFLWVVIRLNTHSYPNIATAQRHTIIVCVCGKENTFPSLMQGNLHRFPCPQGGVLLVR